MSDASPATPVPADTAPASHPRTIHLCNLANVAYGYCKALREDDHDLVLRCHDLKHLMSQPEWDDLELRAEDFPDEFDFYTNTADFGTYRRPDWFLSAGIMPEHYVGLPGAGPAGGEAAGGASGAGEAVGAGEAAAASETPATPSSTPGHSPSRVKAVWHKMPPGLRRTLKPRLQQAQFARSAMRSDVSTVEAVRSYQQLSGERFAHLIERSHELGPDFVLDREMLGAFLPHAWWAKHHADAHHADITFAYVLTPIYAMLLGDRPYVTVEIGTMRDIPFDGSDTGKLLANAYRFSDHAIITNPDVVAQANQLGVESYSFVPHPLDEDLYDAAVDPAFGEELRAKYGTRFLFFAPARQNWDVKGNDRYLKAFARLRADRQDATLIIPGWGQEVERSQQLCRELGIEDAVDWIPPQSEALLVEYYRAADVVLDQFILGVFGLTTPKAMGCSAAVLTSYRPELHTWAFPEHPPLIPAETADEIYAELAALLEHPDRLQAIGAESRRWVERYHSKSVIRSGLEEAMAIAQDRYAARRN